MQNINFTPFTARITWQDIRRYAPIYWVRFFAYSFELTLIFVTSYAIAANDNPGFSRLILCMVILIGSWMLMYRYFHNRWQRRCKVRIKKFAEINNFTYEEIASWSGTDNALSHGTAIELIRPKDKYVVSGKYIGCHFRLGLYSAVRGDRRKEFTYWRPFLRITIKRDVAPNSPEAYAAQDDLSVDVEYKGQYLYIYSARWSFSMQKIAQSIPELFTQAAYLIEEQKKVMKSQQVVTNPNDQDSEGKVA